MLCCSMCMCVCMCVYCVYCVIGGVYGWTRLHHKDWESNKESLEM